MAVRHFCGPDRWVAGCRVLGIAETHAAVKLDSTIFVTGPPAIYPELGRLVAAVPAAAVLSRNQYLAAIASAARSSAWPTWLLIGLIIAFAALAMINTTVMATTGRQRDLALLRLAGATRRQARRALTWEALITTLVGTGCGAVIARISQHASPMSDLTIPPALFGGICAGAALLGMAGSVLPARIMLRVDPMAAARDDQ